MSATHINSYYAATANDGTRYPVLRGTIKTDVCVVGGGFSGLATALSLTERGYKVAVVEAQRVGWGASGRNGGQLIAGISGEHRIEQQLGEAGRKLLADIRYLGHDIIERRVAAHGIACDLKRGWAEVAARPRHMQAIREYVEDRSAGGDGEGLSLVEPDDMSSILGSTLYHGGFVDQRSGHVHPLNLCLGEARAAAALGVLAGYLDPSFKTGPLNGLLFPTGSYIVATETLSEDLAREIIPQDLAVADSNVVLDYFRLSADRRLLFGGRCNYSNRDPADIRETLRPRMVEVFPQLKDVELEFAWGGKIDIVLTRVPAIGRREANVYYMQGYCGHGVNTTHIAADVVADAISGTMERFDLFEKIRHVRLPLGQFLGNQMLALGMLYYRLRDIL